MLKSGHSNHQWTGNAFVRAGSDDEVPVQIGLIGCGKWGRNHAATLARLSVLASVADVIPARRETLATELGCTATTTQELLEDPSITAVVLALPPAEQADIAIRVLSAGKHLLVEKPMALDALRAGRIARAALEAGLVAMTGHLLLFHPAWRAMKAVIAGGALGELRHIRTVRAGWGRFYPGTDVVWDLMPHDLSLVRDLTGSLPPSGQMLATAVVSDRQADVASLQAAFPGGPTLDCFVSRVAPQKERRVMVQGSQASLIWDESRDWSQRLCLSTNPDSGCTPVSSRYLPLQQVQPLTEQLVHFIDAMGGRVEARGTVFGGHDVLHFIQQVHPYEITPGQAQILTAANQS